MRNARRRSNFRCRLRYASRNKWKAPYAKSLIDYWLDTSTINVRVKAIGQIKEKRPTDRERWFLEQVIELVNSRSNPSQTSRLITQRTTVGEVNVDENLKRSRGVAQVLRVRERESDLIQLLGFIVGSVYGSHERANFKPKNKTKLELLAYMQSKLKVRSLWSPIRHPRLSVDIVTGD
ncbi:MAG TPA: hypothetical protein VFM05_02450 [Candidatus Saccharimonadales bacterium]|nr:hypothetical protein [Candidatus Saccharimonadales bacterium]